MRHIEDYALVGDMQTAALVHRDGAIDWLCLPRFDSDACFARLLGDEAHGTWTLGPANGPPLRPPERRYLEDSLVLETVHHARGGDLRVLDLMPPRGEEPDLVRIVECTRGRVRVESSLVPRFAYGAQLPWVRVSPGRASLVAGGDALELATDLGGVASLERWEDGVVSAFELGQGERTAFVLTWHPSHRPAPRPVDPLRALEETLAYWREWSARCTYRGPWREAVVRSLVTLKALTFAPSGGIVAAPTTSLPETLGGVRNWDYRFSWLRDATYTLLALLRAGYVEEAAAWRAWLLRATAGHPAQLQILYGVAGERRLTEVELPWLPGYAGSRPVRIGNAACEQRQLDVYGELMDCLHQARLSGAAPDGEAWDFQRRLLDHLEGIWREPDEGIWEPRSGRRQLTHSKVMAWVAFDRAVAGVERLGLTGPVERWRRVRAELHADVLAHGFDAARGTFVQAYGGHEVDAALLMIPLVGFLPGSDPRVLGTIAAVERELRPGAGLVRRYRSGRAPDGLPPGEGAFLPCSFWLVGALRMAGRHAEARALFERLLALRNDVGLLSEEYDDVAGLQLGNFPQAFSHVALVNAAMGLAGGEDQGPQRHG
ncbi:MAG: glycoside hydrolase family 15 protein [Anaeromyxobacteraceae bacterium]